MPTNSPTPEAAPESPETTAKRIVAGIGGFQQEMREKNIHLGMPDSPTTRRGDDMSGIVASHESWCLFRVHADCCGRTEDDCDCGAGAVNSELADLRAENASLRDDLYAARGHRHKTIPEMAGHSIVDLCLEIERLRADRDTAAAALAGVRSVAERLIAIRDFVSTGHRVSDYGWRLFDILDGPTGVASAPASSRISGSLSGLSGETE